MKASLSSTPYSKEIKFSKFKQLLVFANALLLVSGVCAANAFASTPRLKRNPPVSSLAQLNQILTKSIKQKNLPVYLNPTLVQLSNPLHVQGSSYLHNSCNPYVYNKQALDPVPCWYGSMTAKRTIVIFGDSFVGNWLPALDIAGQKLGFRVAEFEFDGCTVTFDNSLKPSPDFGQSEVDACINFHKNLPRSVNNIHPFAIIAANGDFSWGTVGNSVFVSDLGKAFDEMSSPTNHPIRILLGTGPHLSVGAPSCLASHPNNIDLCNLSYGSGSTFSSALLRDNAAISGARVRLIPTYQWICLNGVCPAVIGNIDVYADSDHLTIAMSKFLSVLLERALTPLLNIPNS
jgi:hypothetical protein